MYDDDSISRAGQVVVWCLYNSLVPTEDESGLTGTCLHAVHIVVGGPGSYTNLSPVAIRNTGFNVPPAGGTLSSGYSSTCT